MRTWIDHAVFWHVYPLGFTGAFPAPDATGPHRLTRLVPWLDYAVELGASALQLGPVFASETHGYDTVDHFRIDPRLGDESDFAQLVAAATDRGLRVVLDGVFNHVGRSFTVPVHPEPAGHPGTAGHPETAGHPAPTEHPATAGHPGAAVRAAPARWLRDGVFEGHDGLVLLNHDEPEVLDHVVRVMTHWLDRGASGWRLDAAYAVPPAFWQAALDRVRPAHPDAWFVGEVIHGDYTGYLKASGLDAITQYELWKAIWSSLNDRNLFELAWALERHNAFVDAGPPQTFVGNHDVTRIASRLTDERHLPHALVTLFTVGGIPSVYYGDEQAFRGVKEDRAGGDDAVRPEFPPTPADLAAYGWPTYRLHQRLIGLRRRHPWLVRAHSTTSALTNTAVAITSTDPADPAHRVVALLNLGDAEARFPADGTNLRFADAGDQPAQGPVPASGVQVPAHGWTILTTP